MPLAAAPSNASLRTIPGAGHFVVKERHREVAAVLAEFLGDLEAGRADV